MSSPQSLLDLVTRLQHIEQNITDILLEAAMKMSSLTDSSVFILVETQEGRKFSGVPHMCDAYRNSQLTPKDTDVECLVDLKSKTISYSSSRTGSSSSCSSSTLRPAQTTLADRPSAPFSRKRPHDAVNDDVVELSMKHSKNNETDEVFSTPAPPSNQISLKSERDDVDDNEIIFLQNSVDESAESSAGGRQVLGGSVLDLQLPPSASLEQSFEALFTQNDIHDMGESMNFGPMVPCDVDAPVDGSKCLPIPPKTVEKMRALSAMNPEDVLQKDGVGAKVLNSVIYDLSKETYQLCLHLGIDSPKDFRSKQLLMDNFEKWFSKNLRHIVHSPIVVKTGRDNSSAIAYCKSIARKYLYSAYKGRKMS